MPADAGTAYARLMLDTSSFTRGVATARASMGGLNTTMVGANKQMDTHTKKTKQVSQGYQTMGDRIKNTMGGINLGSIAAMAGIAGIGVVLWQSISLAGQFETRWSRFTVAMGQSVLSVKGMMQQWEGSIVEVQKATGRTQGYVLDTFSQLGIAGLRNQSIMKGAAEGIAGMSFLTTKSTDAITQSYTRIIKTGNLSNRLLSTMGVGINDVDTVLKRHNKTKEDFTKMSADERAAILNEAMLLKNSAQGNAAYAQSYEGMISRVTAAYQGILKRVGLLVLPIVLKGLDVALEGLKILSGAFDSAVKTIRGIWNSLPDWAQFALEMIGVAAAVKVILIPAMILVAGYIYTTVIPAVGAFISEMIVLTLTMLANPFTYVVLAIVALVAAFYELGKALGWWSSTGDMAGKILGTLAGYFKTLWSAISGFIGWIGGIATNVWDTFMGAFFDSSGNWVGLLQGFQNLGGAIYNYLISIDWMGLLVQFWGFLQSLNPLTWIWNMLFSSDGGTSLWTSVTAWFMGIDWMGLLTSIFSVLAQYNPVTLFISFLFGDAAGATFSAAVMATFMNVLRIVLLFVGLVINGVTNLKATLMAIWSAIWASVSYYWGIIGSTIVSVMSKIYNGALPYINGVKSAFNGMKDGLVGAANTIRDKVWGPINTLWSNLKGFWNWLSGGGSGGGGSKTGGGKPAGNPLLNKTSVNTSSLNGRVNGGSALLYAGGFADGIANMAFQRTQSITGIHPLNQPAPAGGPDGEIDWTQVPFQKGCKDDSCYAAGFNFSSSWIDKAIGMVKNWKLNIFGTKIGLNTLKSGSMAAFTAIANALIGRTRYDFYYGDKYSNAEAIRRGAFNCYDGAQIMISLANAMGLPGSMVHGTWSGIPHVWANINGVNFDTTAKQQRGTWNPPAAGGPGKRYGYGFGSGINTINVYVTISNSEVHDKGSLKKVVKEGVKDGLNDIAEDM